MGLSDYKTKKKTAEPVTTNESSLTQRSEHSSIANGMNYGKISQLSTGFSQHTRDQLARVGTGRSMGVAELAAAEAVADEYKKGMKTAEKALKTITTMAKADQSFNKVKNDTILELVNIELEQTQYAMDITNKINITLGNINGYLAMTESAKALGENVEAMHKEDIINAVETAKDIATVYNYDI